MSTLLRVATAGSVDDGKSTLIGRLLVDAKLVLADQMAAVERTSLDRGGEMADLSLITDGLRAEREQGITIDVAYRYFSTGRRSFVLADTPGHVQYTRNMVTGASTADAAVVLIDARHGVVEQTRRHASIAALLRVPHLVLAVNKMDLVDFDQEVYDGIVADFAQFAAPLDVADVHAIPLSALAGDNVVDASPRTPYYEGPPLLAHLEQLPTPDRSVLPARLAVQYVIRPRTAEHHDYRGYAGLLTSGTLAAGDEVVILPSGLRSSIAGIDTPAGPADHAVAGQSITVRLADDIDVSRGDLIAPVADAPATGQDLTATITWMTTTPLRAGARYLLKHTTRTVKAVISSVDSVLDVETLGATAATELALNDIGQVTLRTAGPLAADTYRDDRATGAFILIDEPSGATVGAGLVESRR
jgi:sulfate adenylyltransferase subunit 1